MFGGCASVSTGCEPVDLVLYSPAPPNIMLHEHNQALADQLSSCAAFGEVEVRAVALPDSLYAIQQVDPVSKPFHLPIMTAPDFQTALDGTAPEWHAYDPAETKLKFVTELYDVSFGILVFDPSISTPADLRGKRIGVPARPSSVRWMTEVLLQDGWGLGDEVSLVELTPPEVAAAISNGQIDATSWSIMSETPDGFRPMVPQVLAIEGAHWLAVDAETMAAINSANPFETVVTEVTGLTDGRTIRASLVSFGQGLAAWEDTPDQTVRDILACLQDAEMGFGAGPFRIEARLDWPGLFMDDVHPAAR